MLQLLRADGLVTLQVVITMKAKFENEMKVAQTKEGALQEMFKVGMNMQQHQQQQQQQQLALLNLMKSR